MEIVTNNTMLRYFKTIKYFKVDLGTNIKGPVQKKKDPDFTIKIRDEFIKKYQSLTNHIIFKYGDIGTLKFYEDNSIPANEFHIYDNEKIYEIVAKKDDLDKEAITYLTEVLQMIESGEKEKEKVEEIKEYKMVKNITYTNMPEEIARPDMSLPRDQYIEALVTRRKLMNRL
ncbi:MAG: hypothetical protein HPY57_14115 [Ignavibacteria bacterium]|nr:hypothetical protein [Ignavibacteria bacterium]